MKVCITSYITGAAAIVVFGAASRFGVANVPAGKIILVSGVDNEYKIEDKLRARSGGKRGETSLSSRVPLSKVLYEKPDYTG